MPLGPLEETLRPVVRMAHSFATAGPVLHVAVPPVSDTSAAGLTPLGLEVVGLGLVPSANTTVNFDLVLQEILPNGTVGSTRNVTIEPLTANVPHNVVLSTPFRVDFNNNLRLHLPSAVTGLTCDVTLWVRVHQIDLPEQRQQIGLGNV